MATAGEVVNRALSLILVQPSEAPLQPDETLTALETLNDMMAEWAANGLSIGYQVATSLSTDIGVPPYSLSAIKQNLAIRLAPEFVINPPSALLMSNAARSYKALMNIVIDVGPASYPETLPTGSGNTGDGCWNDRFYPPDDDVLLDELGGSIELES